MSGKYQGKYPQHRWWVEVNGQAIPCPEEEWGKSYEVENRIVEKDNVGKLRVSTVFLGLNHNFGEGPPLLYETMAFPEKSWDEKFQDRYTTREQAKKGHEKLLKWLTDGNSVNDYEPSTG